MWEMSSRCGFGRGQREVNSDSEILNSSDTEKGNTDTKNVGETG